MQAPEEGEEEDYEENEEFIFDEEEGLLGAPVASPVAKSLVTLSHSTESLDKRIDELVGETASLMGISETVAGVLLRAFDWQTDALIQEWFSNSAAVLEKGRLPPELHEGGEEREGRSVLKGKAAAAVGSKASPSFNSPSADASRSCSGADACKDEEEVDEEEEEEGEEEGEEGSDSGLFECPVTASFVPLADTFALKCGHRYSKEAWLGYLDALLSEGPRRALDARCPFFGCFELVPAAAWRSFRGPEAAERLQMFSREQFVAKRQAVAWCPSPKCSRAVELVPAGSGANDCCSGASLCQLSAAEVAAAADVTCACGTRFCLVCGGEPHRPISCRVIAAWSRKNVREADSVAWISCNTQPCPKCHRPIQKDLGCMHMRCYCQHEFCWLCLGDWKQHSTASFYRCNIYEKQNQEGKPDAGRTDTQHLLERYAHFFERYRAHSHGQQVAAGMQVEQLNRCREVAAGLAGGPLQRPLRRPAASLSEAGSESEDRGLHAGASAAAAAGGRSRSRRSQQQAAGGEVAGGARGREEQQAREALARREEMKAFHANFEWDFLESGWMQVIECRRMLKWSYAFAYFAEFPESRQKHLFEFHQGQLERNLDILQEKLETFDAADYLDKDPADLLKFKIQLVDLTSVVRGFFAKIFDVFEDEFVAAAVHVNERDG
ncbi:hypothetical protein Efla_006229 [Eimeria flavescens]